MLRTRFSIAAFVLAAVFLTAAQVQADDVPSFIQFTFHKVEGSGPLVDFSNLLHLTATEGSRFLENEERLGVELTFISTWANGTANDGGGVIWNKPVGEPSLAYKNVVFLTNTGYVLGSEYEGGDVIWDTEPLYAQSSELIKQSGTDEWKATTFIPYKSSPPSPNENTWDDFYRIATKTEENDPLGFRIRISGDGGNTNVATFETNPLSQIGEATYPTPEPATLLILGGGLAGLGIAARRRKK